VAVKRSAGLKLGGADRIWGVANSSWSEWRSPEVQWLWAVELSCVTGELILCNYSNFFLLFIIQLKSKGDGHTVNLDCCKHALRLRNCFEELKEP